MVTVTEQDFTNLNEIEKIQVIKDILQGKVILKEGKTNEQRRYEADTEQYLCPSSKGYADAVPLLRHRDAGGYQRKQFK